MRLSVRCFAPNGNPLDSRFTASYTTGGGTANTYGFAWADQPTNAGPYPARAAYQYNNSGGAITVRRVDPGTYQVTMPNNYNPRGSGSVKVTAVGDTAAHCKVQGWGPSLTAQVIDVRCFTHTGQPADQQFSIAYLDGMNHVGSNLMSQAYVWADQPSSSSYPPALAYQRSRNMNDTGTITITSPEVGVYNVLLPHQDVSSSWDGGNVQVSAYGQDGARCQIGYWRGSDASGYGDRTVRVYCFTAAGVPTDTRFTLQYAAQIQ